MSGVVPFPGNRRVCACGWHLPTRFGVEVRAPHVRLVGDDPHPNVECQFDCPQCSKRFEVSFDPAHLTIEQPGGGT